MRPLVKLVPVQTTPPSLQDNTADLDRLKKGLYPLLDKRWPFVPLPRLATVAASFRRAGFKGVALVNDLPSGPELVDFLPAAPPFVAGLALDLGTSYLEASLVDLASGKILAGAHQENPQLAFGSDILTRIQFAEQRTGNGDSGLAVLHDLVIAGVNRLAADLAGQVGISAGEIRALSVAGNTTMAHFFLKLDPRHLCREPYIPLANFPDPCRGSDLGLAIDPMAPVWIMPGAGSYFGGDLIAGILASGLDRSDKICMLIDVGTNAEVVVGNRDWLIACAGAAGPALEDGVTRMGMRAAPGAIEHIDIDAATGAVSFSTIDRQPARGICGSGIIDLVAGLYLARVIDARGRFRQAPGLPVLRERLVELEEGPAFIVAPADSSAGGRPVSLSQVDLDALLRSKAAMYAILSTVINQVNLGFADLERIYVAGAFGGHISPRQAIVLGLLPDLPLSVYVPLGNSSLAGAEKILLDGSARDRCRAVLGKVTYLELNVNQEFMGRFSGSRFIPHTDSSLFPSVPFFNEP